MSWWMEIPLEMLEYVFYHPQNDNMCLLGIVSLCMALFSSIVLQYNHITHKRHNTIIASVYFKNANNKKLFVRIIFHIQV